MELCTVRCEGGDHSFQPLDTNFNCNYKLVEGGIVVGKHCRNTLGTIRSWNVLCDVARIHQETHQRHDRQEMNPHP